MPDAAGLAIAWANGISFHTTDPCREQWWQPTDAPLLAVDVQPQGQALAAALVDGSIIVFDVDGGEPQRFAGAEPHAHHGDVTWSPDGERIAFQFVGPRRRDPIYLLDVATGATTRVPGSQIEEGKIPALNWTPDGKGITLTDFDEGCTQLLDVETGETLFTLQYDDTCYLPYGMTWTSDGDLLGLAGTNGVVLVDLRTAGVVQTLEGSVLGTTFSRGAYSNGGQPLAFGAHGSLLAGKGGLGIRGNDLFPLIVWDVETGRRLAVLDEASTVPNQDRLAIGFDGETLLSLYANGQLTRLSLADEPAQEQPVGHIPVAAPQEPLVWSAGGRLLAAPNRYGGALVWDVAARDLVARFEAPLDNPVLSPGGHLIALMDREAQELLVYDLRTGKRIQTLPTTGVLPAGIAFSPDGSRLAYGANNRLSIADLATGERLATLSGYLEDQLIARIAWAAEGDALVASGADPQDTSAPGTVILWEQAQDGSFRETLRTEAIHTDNESVAVALFNPTGTLVALERAPSDSGPFETLIYDREAGQVIQTLEEHLPAAWGSGSALLTRQVAGQIQLVRWDVRTGERTVGAEGMQLDEVYAPGGLHFARPTRVMRRGLTVHDWLTGDLLARGIHGSEPLQIAWSPGGRWIASLAHDSSLKIWPIDHPPASPGN